ncbi:cytochrome c biogenesis protein CcdA [Herbinix luporum]|uniref:redoxin domain-containing protein n=1 Tax=Herbinix luporum TaxID=1679721 RepID=UPI0023F1304C|nr:cytochrome c biogenesis protein CcdA [Herbinix luporum]
MLDNLLSLDNISFLLVFIEGFLSFLSPCVIPLIPIYMSYLAGNAKQTDEEGRITYKQTAVFIHTIFFVLGISFAFFLLGMTFTALGTFFKTNQLLFTRIGGILIISLGLYQVGLLDIKFLHKERKLRLNLINRQMNPLAAFIMGFTFSFAWTPCVGPALSSVLILASGAKSSLIGNLLVLIYAVGFIIPFLLLGLFTSQVLNFLKSKQKLLKYTVKIGGVILILIGIMTFTGWMNGISKYLNKISQPLGSKQEEQNEDTISDKEISKDDNSNDDNSPNNTSEEKEKFPAIDFTLKDQYGNEHTLSDYKGKVVFLNFWATWCNPCLREMPDIEKIYKQYGKNQEEVIILAVANPSSDEYPNNADVSKDEIIAFLDENGYTFPVVFDETGNLLSEYLISAFPTTFLIDKEGNISGYAPGMLTKDMMDNVIEQTLNSTQ